VMSDLSPIDRGRVSSPSILRGIVISFLGRSGIFQGSVRFPTLLLLRSVLVAGSRKFVPCSSVSLYGVRRDA